MSESFKWGPDTCLGLYCLHLLAVQSEGDFTVISAPGQEPNYDWHTTESQKSVEADYDYDYDDDDNDSEAGDLE